MTEALPSAGAVAGLFAAILQLFGYAAYLRALRRRQVRPNATSWVLWTVGSILSLIVYAKVTHDWLMLLLPIACALASLMVLAWLVIEWHFVRADRGDYLTVVADLLVVAVWLVSNDATIVYVALLIDTGVAFVPILRSVRADPQSEVALPWVIWTIAYGAMVLAGLLRYDGWEPLALPLLYVVLHAIVGYSATRPVQAGLSRAALGN